MYAIVEISGHQYKVDAGRIVDVPKLDAEAGSMIDFSEVLLVGGAGETIVGTPKVAGAKIKAKVVEHDKDRKILVMRRKNGQWQKKHGHRTHYTTLLITEVDNGKGGVKTIDPASKEAIKFLK